MKYMFTMSCGHEEEREVAVPEKYLKIDSEYYNRQGLCSACWEKLHERHRKHKTDTELRN